MAALVLLLCSLATSLLILTLKSRALNEAQQRLQGRPQRRRAPSARIAQSPAGGAARLQVCGGLLLLGGHLMAMLLRTDRSRLAEPAGLAGEAAVPLVLGLLLVALPGLRPATFERHRTLLVGAARVAVFMASDVRNPRGLLFIFQARAAWGVALGVGTAAGAGGAPGVSVPPAMADPIKALPAPHGAIHSAIEGRRAGGQAGGTPKRKCVHRTRSPACRGRRRRASCATRGSCCSVRQAGRGLLAPWRPPQGRVGHMLAWQRATCAGLGGNWLQTRAAAIPAPCRLACGRHFLHRRGMPPAAHPAPARLRFRPPSKCPAHVPWPAMPLSPESPPVSDACM